MTPINLVNLHDKLTTAGIPVVSVRLTKDLQIELQLADDVTAEQKLSAAVIVEQYDQAAMDAAQPTFEGPLSVDEIEAAKSIPELKALLIKAFTTKG